MSKHPSKSEDWIIDGRRRLAEWRGKKPKTRAGQIRALWPEIKAALEQGQTLGSLRDWLEQEVGVVVTTDVLGVYVRRCRAKDIGPRIRNDLISPDQKLFPAIVVPRTTSANVTQSVSAHDPMATAREALNKPRFDIRKIHANGDPTGSNLV